MTADERIERAERAVAELAVFVAVHLGRRTLTAPNLDELVAEVHSRVEAEAVARRSIEEEERQAVHARVSKRTSSVR